ncbi:MAG: hypothetical protein IMW90_18905 [Thermogemmatispora sp.]|uniref:hypothetical protein n=1 Tax=Thermogemmatispora sp. TaxID=1968838 RepID=UPI0019E763D5|nr:hypothetical protein [Thermogemmatispora sp.]MBE3567792.1 hypothetical protein [Thermogemmatispora sp.]
MRQADGSELLGAGDPRAEEIGVIYVAPTDERKDVLTAILTQEKLGRKQIAIVLPEQNRAFQRRVDFEVLKMRRNPQARLIFIAPPRSEPAEYARQRRFPVYSSLDNYVRSLQDMWEEGKAEEGQGPAWSQRLRRLLRLRGGESKPIGTAAEPVRQRPHLEGETPTRKAEPGAGSAPPEPVESSSRGRSAGSAAAAGALAGAAAGLGWAVLQSEREQAASKANEERSPAELGTLDDEEELPPVEKAGAGAPSSAVSPLPEGKSEQQGATSGAVVEAGAAGVAGAAAAQAAEEIQQQQQEGTRARAVPPRSPASGAGPGIIQFPHSRRITAKLPVASNAYTPEAEPARRGSSSPSDRGAALGAGALAGAAAGAAFAGAGLGASGGGSGTGAAAGAGAGAGSVVPPSGVSTLPPPLTPLRQRGTRQRRRGPFWLALVAILLVLLLIGCGALAAVNPKLLGPVAAMMPFGTPGATVTITPASVDLKNQYLITGVTGQPDAAQREIQARVLTAAPAAQTKTVPATGHGQTPGVQARGTITFGHAGSAWESVLSGTTFTLQNGLKITTDETVSLPPTTLTNPVYRTARAHVVQAGSIGNLPAGAINNQPCCGSNDIFATSGAFTGGQDPQSYTFVQQSDIDNAANPLKASLAQQAQQQFQRQIRPGEQLISQPNCSTSVKSDHQAGDHANSVTVTVSASCSGEAFDKQGALRLGASLLSQEAGKRLAAGYALVGQIITTIDGATPISKGSISITVTAEGRWAYQFDDAAKKRLAQLIAGKSKSEALQLLQRQSGVKEADIAIFHGSDRLPSDANQIAVTIGNVSGLSPAPSASIGPGPTSSPTAAPTAPSPGNTPTSGKG